MTWAVVVTGARSGARLRAVCEALTAWHDQYPVGVLIHGDCPDPKGGAGRSVDACADDWARRYRRSGLVRIAMPAAWDALPTAGGPRRNLAMLKSLRQYEQHGGAVAVLAFDGGAGTADCVAQAQRMHVPVYRWECGAWEQVGQQSLFGHGGRP